MGISFVCKDYLLLKCILTFYNFAWVIGRNRLPRYSKELTLIITISVVCRENNFNFPTSLYRKKFEQKYFPGKKEEEKPGLGKDDVARFKREISRDFSKTEDLKVYDKSKLAESLPFGDIIEKYNKLKEDLKKATAR